MSLFLVFGNMQAKGQILDNSRGMLAVEDILFRKEFLVRNGIMEISESHQLKPPGQPIKNKPDQAIMTFDREGRLINHFRISSASGKPDTLQRIYSYQQGGLTRMLQIHRRQVHEEVLLSRGDTLYVRNNRLASTSDPLPPADDLIWMYDEKIAVKRAKGITAYLRYNNDGKPYLRTTLIQDSAGLLLEERQEYLVTHQTQRTMFTYNKRGLVTKREEHLANGHTKHWEFLYDAFYNVIEVKFFRNETYKWRMEFLYTPMGLLDAALKQHQDTKNIEIIRYSYEFHPNTHN